MSIVNLVSGGIDSTLISVMLKEEEIPTFPLFIDYGQKAREMEWAACQAVHVKLNLPQPKKVDIAGFGQLIESGLTVNTKDIVEDAFTPGRNLLFLLIASAYAYQVGANGVAIGLLSEQYSLFPDQSMNFIEEAHRTITLALGKGIEIVTPLSEFSKADVLALAKERNIIDTYSCHSGQSVPCGNCISCLEILKAKI